MDLLIVPSFRYHATEAPDGQLFETAAELEALGPDWVDTPAKFPPPARIDERTTPRKKKAYADRD